MAQGLFQQIGSEIAATASLCQCMALEVIHHPTGKRDVDPLGASRIRHLSSAGGRRDLLVQVSLQLTSQVLENWHDFDPIFSLK